MVQFEDTTRYSRDDRVREPRSFSVWFAGCQLTVTRHCDYEPDEWVMRFRPITGDEPEPLASRELRAAQIEAARDVYTWAADLSDEARQLLRSLEESDDV